MKDESPEVRIELTKQGYGLEKFVHDEDWMVRLIIAEQGNYHEILVNDENNEVSKEALRQKNL